MNDHDEELEQLKQLIDEVKNGLEAAAKVKKVSDHIIGILENLDEAMALTVATVVAGRVINSVAKNGVAAKCMSATMHARIYEFVHMNFDDEEEDEEEQTLQ
jgi:uncharacterized protein (UPF0147 family)